MGVCLCAGVLCRRFPRVASDSVEGNKDRNVNVAWVIASEAGRVALMPTDTYKVASVSSEKGERNFRTTRDSFAPSTMSSIVSTSIACLEVEVDGSQSSSSTTTVKCERFTSPSSGFRNATSTQNVSSTAAHPPLATFSDPPPSFQNLAHSSSRFSHSDLMPWAFPRGKRVRHCWGKQKLKGS